MKNDNIEYKAPVITMVSFNMEKGYNGSHHGSGETYFSFLLRSEERDANGDIVDGMEKWGVDNNNGSGYGWN